MKAKIMTNAELTALQEKYDAGTIDITDIYPKETVVVIDGDDGWVRVDVETKASRPATVINRVAKALCKIFEGIDDITPWIKESIADGYFREVGGSSFVWGLEAIDEETWYFYMNVNINVHDYITRR